MSRLRLLAVLPAFLLAMGAGETASAAPPLTLGQSASSTAGGCTLCTAVQFATAAGSPYLIPADGVLVRAGFYVGPTTEASDFAQARAFSKTGAGNAVVTAEGTKHPLDGLDVGLHTFFERIPVAVGDVLGARFDSTPNVNGTPATFTTPSPLDEAGTTVFPTDPELGDGFATSVFGSQRVNVRALFEVDEDHDGYGDTSQDLCPGSPVGGAACSGTLFGGDMQGAFIPTSGSCTYACIRVQKSIAGASTAVPFAGVVVRWRLLSAPAGDYGIRVLSPTDGPSYRITALSSPESVADPGSTAAIDIFQTRLPIPSGSYVGLAPPPFEGQPYRELMPGSAYTTANDGPTGTEVPLGGSAGNDRELLYNADIEPDADGDGYGDISQDACPSDGSSAGGACPQSPPPPVVIVDEFESCGGKRATRVGTAGKDDLKGTKRADVFVALGGDDTIKALAGNDLVCAGKGRDTVLGGPGKDRLIGEGGVDTLRGGPGKDKLIGGPGKDLQRQ
ncbi:MAG TPA: calcium-binding protein [Solirubrobacterales bacterium]